MKKDHLKLPHLYLCTACAIERGGIWPEGHVATCHQDRCPYCQGEGWLACVSDYDWPDARLNEQLAAGMD